MYCPNVYWSSTATDANGQADDIRFSGETTSTRKGWVGVDCSGLSQFSAWLAGWRASDNSAYEFGRIGSLDNKGNINMNTWGGEKPASFYDTTASHTQDVTKWIPTDTTSPITILSGMGPIRKGDLVFHNINTVTFINFSSFRSYGMMFTGR